METACSLQPTPYFNPRSSCEERLPLVWHVQHSRLISIHAPHARSDCKPSLPMSPVPKYFNPRSSCEERPSSKSYVAAARHFNPRSSCEERPDKQADYAYELRKFQSTLLMRGATVSLSSIDLLDFIIHFSRTQHLFPKTLLLTLCPVSSISCVMALRA